MNFLVVQKLLLHCVKPAVLQGEEIESSDWGHWWIVAQDLLPLIVDYEALEDIHSFMVFQLLEWNILVVDDTLLGNPSEDALFCILWGLRVHLKK